MESTSITRKYVRKPLYVDAVQVTEQNFSDIARWCFGEIGNIDETPVDQSHPVDPTKQYIHVRVHNPKNTRQTRAFVGDWILYTERGYKVYTTKAFQANFDLIDEAIEPEDDETQEEAIESENGAAQEEATEPEDDEAQEEEAA